MNPVSSALHYKFCPYGKTNFDNSNAVWFDIALNAKNTCIEEGICIVLTWMENLC